MFYVLIHQKALQNGKKLRLTGSENIMVIALKLELVMLLMRMVLDF